MNDNQDEPRSFQFGIRAMLITTTVFGILLSVLKAIGCPTAAIALLVGMFVANVLLLVLMLLLDSVWFKRDTDEADFPDGGDS